MIVGIAAAGAGRAGPSTPAPGGGDSPPGAILVSDSGWSGPQGILPVQPRIEPASAYERGARIKVPVLVSAMAAASLTFVVACRRGFRQRHGSPLPLVQRARSLPRRAPPVLQLG